MATEFSLDLRTARRKSGFTQRDIAHLLAARQSRVSDFEHGRRIPGLTDIVTLSLIYGRSFESLFAALMHDVKQELKERLSQLPEDVREYVGTFNRSNSIKRLRHRLSDEETPYGGS